MNKLQRSTDYKRFAYLTGNRPVDLNHSEARDLLDSMCEYGFLPAFPIMVRVNGSGKNEIVDGQHRFAIAKELGLPVYYVVDNSDVDISKINKAQRKWRPEDHCHKWASEGKEAYIELQEFHEQWQMPFTICAAMLGGTIRFANVSPKFYRGDFEIKERKLAHNLAQCYSRICECNKDFRNACYVKALWACFFVDYFDPDRLVDVAQKDPQLVRKCGDQGSALEIIEEMYNFRKRTRQPLKFDAEQVMRDRNPGVRKEQKYKEFSC